MRLRKMFFWLHLTCGVTAGTVILIMSATGAILAFQPQILRFLDREARIVTPPARGAVRLGPEELLHCVREQVPEAKPTAITLDADPEVAALFVVGRDEVRYVNPYTGAVTGTGSQTGRQFFRTVTDWHRWLALTGDSRPTGRAITGACNAAFLVLALSGIVIWWPKSWSRKHTKPAMLFQPGLRGRARDWNWHNVIGFWTLPVLVVLTATGMVISYRWAGDLLYLVTGNTAPAAVTPDGEGPVARATRGAAAAPPGEGSSVSDEELRWRGMSETWSQAELRAPGWRAMTLRLPEEESRQVTFSIQEEGAVFPFLRSQLTLDRRTGEELRWEPFDSLNAGRKLRVWFRFAHTGEAGGLAGQMAAFIACVGGVFLVYTGVALACRRLVAWRQRRRSLSEERASPAGTTADECG